MIVMKPLKSLVLIAIAGFLLNTSAALANTITHISVPDFSFETANVAGQTFPGAATQPFTGWTPGYTGGQTNWTYGQAALSGFTTTGTADGSSFLEFYHHYHGYTFDIETTNPVVASIDNNATYTLTVSMGYEASQLPADDTIELLSGSTVLASKVVTSGMLTSGTFTDFSASFNTLSGANASYVGQNLSIEILSPLTSASSTYSDFDNVRLTENMVPEPHTWALILFAAGALSFLGYRQRLKID